MFCADCGTIADPGNVIPGIGVICKKCGSDDFVSYETKKKLDMLQLKWSKEIPSKEGFYFTAIKRKDQIKDVHVFDFKEIETIQKQNGRVFAGPIPLPIL